VVPVRRNAGTICFSCRSSGLTPAREDGERIQKKIKDAGRRSDGQRIGMLQFPFVTESWASAQGVSVKNNHQQHVLKACQEWSARGSTARSSKEDVRMSRQVKTKDNCMQRGKARSV
jgi:hypothetical protein